MLQESKLVLAIACEALCESVRLGRFERGGNLRPRSGSSEMVAQSVAVEKLEELVHAAVPRRELPSESLVFPSSQETEKLHTPPEAIRG